MDRAPPDDNAAHATGLLASVTDSEATPCVTLFICLTCRLPETGPDAPPAGAALAAAADAAPSDPRIRVRGVRCLANCKRALSAAMVRTDGWSYVFGDLGPDSASDLLAGARLFADAPDGLMPWRGRPDGLKRGMIARLPPLSLPEDPR